MPSLGADMEDGTLVEWLAKPGDTLKRGDIIAIVETQKGAIEIEVFEEGVLEQTIATPGDKLPVGAVMARISGVGAPGARSTPAPPRPAPKQMTPPRAPSPISEPAPTGRVSPAARRLAAERQVDLSKVKGTGPGGAVTIEDVVAQTAAAPTPSSGMRQVIAAAMTRSKREIPHYYLAHTIDIAPAEDWIAAENAKRLPAERLLVGALYVKATARAARAFPEFNGFFIDNVFQPSAAIHVGVAIAIRGGGLVAPAIHDAADLSLDDLMTKMRDLVQRVRAGRFRSSEIADPTITVTSLGERGVDAVWGIIYPPQVAIVGFGRTTTRPWAVADQILPRATVAITIAADHRVSDGHRGALFLEHIGQLLVAPQTL